jgi:hypothetical protein
MSGSQCLFVNPAGAPSGSFGSSLALCTRPAAASRPLPWSALTCPRLPGLRANCSYGFFSLRRGKKGQTRSTRYPKWKEKKLAFHFSTTTQVDGNDFE